MESFCAGPAAPGAVNGGISFWLVKKKCPRTPKEKIALGGGREVAGPVRRQVEVAEVGWPCPSPTAHNSLRSRRCRTDIDTGSAATAGSNARSAMRAVIRLRRLRNCYVTAECAFFGAPLPFLWAGPKKWGGFVPRRALPCAHPAEKWGGTVRDGATIRHPPGPPPVRRRTPPWPPGRSG